MSQQLIRCLVSVRIIETSCGQDLCSHISGFERRRAVRLTLRALFNSINQCRLTLTLLLVSTQTCTTLLAPSLDQSPIRSSPGEGCDDIRYCGSRCSTRPTWEMHHGKRVHYISDAFRQLIRARILECSTAPTAARRQMLRSWHDPFLSKHSSRQSSTVLSLVVGTSWSDYNIQPSTCYVESQMARQPAAVRVQNMIVSDVERS